MDLTEAEDIKKWWQEYTEELYKKDLHDPGNQDGVITYLEPDILECEVKWDSFFTMCITREARVRGRQGETKDRAKALQTSTCLI